jgi:hypothetical protein
MLAIPGMMRGRGRGGPLRGKHTNLLSSFQNSSHLILGPPRGMNPGMNRGGRGRFPSGPGGRFPSDNGNGYFNNQNQNENNPAPAPVAQPEPVAEKPIAPVTQSSNNVQVVTSGPTQPAPTSQPPSQAAPAQSNPPMNNSSRGSYTPRGRGSFGSSRGGFVGRGRGYQGQGPPRQQFDTRQPSNLTPASTNTFNPIKRGGHYSSGPGGPGAKRGRYDQGPGGYSGNRSMPPQNQISSMPPQQHHQNSYNSVPP